MFIDKESATKGLGTKTMIIVIVMVEKVMKENVTNLILYKVIYTECLFSSYVLLRVFLFVRPSGWGVYLCACVVGWVFVCVRVLLVCRHVLLDASIE